MEFPVENSSRLFLSLVRQRYQGEKLETYKKFILLLAKYTPDAANGGIETMFADVKVLFASDQYLVEKFGNLVNCCQNNNKKPVQKKNKMSKDQTIADAVEFLNKVRRALKDPEEFEKFVEIMTSEEELINIKNKVFKLLEKHPMLMKELSGCLAEKMAKESGKSKAEEHRKLRLEWEDAMHVKDFSFKRFFSVKESAKRLISENLNKDPMEKMDVGAYFSVLDIMCTKELRGCRRLLLDKFKRRGKAIKASKKIIRRGKAIKASKKIIRCAEKKIKKLTRLWNLEKKKMAVEMREEENQIPVFDWRNDYNEDVPKLDWLRKTWKNSRGIVKRDCLIF